MSSVLTARDHAPLSVWPYGVNPFAAGRVAPPPPGRGALHGIVAEEQGFLSLLDVDRLSARGER